MNRHMLMIFLIGISLHHLSGQSPTAIPALSLNNPTIFSAGRLGFFGAGLVFQSSERVNPRNDWRDPGLNAGAYVGLGDPERWLGLGLGVNLFGLSNTKGSRDNLGESSLDIHLSRRLGDNLYVGGGILNVVNYKAVYINALRAFYAGGSWRIPLKTDADRSFGRLYLSAGAGNGKFQNRSDFLEAENRGVNVFGGAALQVLPNGNFLLEWTGSDLTAAFSVFPFKKMPIHLIVGVSDLNFSKQRYIAVVSYSLRTGRAKEAPLVYPLSLSPQ